MTSKEWFSNLISYYNQVEEKKVSRDCQKHPDLVKRDFIQKDYWVKAQGTWERLLTKVWLTSILF